MTQIDEHLDDIEALFAQNGRDQTPLPMADACRGASCGSGVDERFPLLQQRTVLARLQRAAARARRGAHRTASPCGGRDAGSDLRVHPRARATRVPAARGPRSATGLRCNRRRGCEAGDRRIGRPPDPARRDDAARHQPQGRPPGARRDATPALGPADIPAASRPGVGFLAARRAGLACAGIGSCPRRRRDARADTQTRRPAAGG